MPMQIRPMTAADTDAKGYVHWKSWQETYPGLIDDDHLANMTLDKCREIARRWLENVLVAELDGKIVGFAGYGPCRDEDLPGCGEIIAIYILKEAQGLGLGRKLMDAALVQLSGCNTIAIWVLEGNAHAIEFYKHYGFRFDGTSKEHRVGTELRLVYRR